MLNRDNPEMIITWQQAGRGEGAMTDLFSKQVVGAMTVTWQQAGREGGNDCDLFSKQVGGQWLWPGSEKVGGGGGAMTVTWQRAGRGGQWLWLVQ